MKSFILKRFDENPVLLKIISKKFFEECLNDANDNGSLKHPVAQGIVWNIDLPSWLLFLEERRLDLYEKFLRKIKTCNNSWNFKALMSELRVVVFYLKRFSGKDELEYEPQSTKKKKTDLLIRLNGKEIHFEVTALMDDAEQRESNAHYDHFCKTVEEIKPIPFAVSFELPYQITKKEVDEFDKFIVEAIETRRLKTEKKFVLEFTASDGHKFKLWLDRVSWEGGVFGNVGGARILSEDERVRRKLLYELDQVPRDKPVILIIDLTNSLFSQFEFFLDAVLGSKTYVVDAANSTSRPVRINGFFYEAAARNITGVLGFRDYLENSRFVYNGSTKFLLSQDEQKLLMPENIFKPIEDGNNS